MQLSRDLCYKDSTHHHIAVQLVLAKWFYVKICSSHDGATIASLVCCLISPGVISPWVVFFKGFYSRTHILWFRQCVSKREITGFYISWPVCCLKLGDSQAK